MENIQKILSALWEQLAHSLGSEVMAILVVAGMVTVIVGVWLLVGALRKSEFFKQHQAMWELVDDRIADLIWLIEFGDVDLADYQRRAEEREAEGLSTIDPRMLYLLDKAGEWVETRLGVKLDMEELLARAEHIFDEVKKSDTNSVGE